MTLSGVALVAEQRHSARQGLDEGVEEISLRREVFSEVREVACQVVVFAQPMADYTGRSEPAFMLVGDAGVLKGRRQGAL